MKIPVEFDEICESFYQGIMLHYPTFEAQFEMVLAERSRQHLEIAKNFLDELLCGKYDAEQLNVIWSMTSADLAIRDGADKSAPDALRRTRRPAHRGYSVVRAFPIARRGKNMEMPKAFESICSYFFRGVEEGHDSGEEILQAAVSGLTAEERAVAKQYLDEILDGRYDDDQLERIWHDAGAELRIVRRVEGDVAGVLAMLRSAIAS